ncbi:MAG: RidA family protein [Oscillospiraceae bacterium]
MKKAISTTKAPSAIGPYSQAVEVGEFIFTSGQIPLDPKTGKMPTDIADCTRQSLENIKAILEAVGSDMSKVVKTNVFLADMKDFAAMNDVYAQYFSGGVLPARSAVEVAQLPKGARVEIEAVAQR